MSLEHSPARHGGSFTINEWCQRRRISRSMFYKLDAQGKGPHTHNVGSSRRISAEADAAWVREREAEDSAKEAG